MKPFLRLTLLSGASVLSASLVPAHAAPPIRVPRASARDLPTLPVFKAPTSLSMRQKIVDIERLLTRQGQTFETKNLVSSQPAMMVDVARAVAPGLDVSFRSPVSVSSLTNQAFFAPSNLGDLFNGVRIAFSAPKPGYYFFDFGLNNVSGVDGKSEGTLRLIEILGRRKT